MARPAVEPLHPGGVGDRGRQLGGDPVPAVDLHLDRGDAAVRRPGDAGDGHLPGVTELPSRGTSIRDWVRIGASFAQPSGTQ